MSSGARPISPTQFREAIQDLPISNLHAKAAELRNSIQHLKSSNAQLQEFADAGDRDCKEAIKENEDVVDRMETRILLLKVEVEGRGMLWLEDEGYKEGVLPAEPGEEVAPVVNGVNGDRDVEMRQGGTQDGARTDAPTNEAREGQAQATSGRLTDEELRRMLARRMGDPDGGGEDEEEQGVHL
jgi:hypothetical protein